jgi:cytidine deaminase
MNRDDTAQDDTAHGDTDQDDPSQDDPSQDDTAQDDTVQDDTAQLPLDELLVAASEARHRSYSPYSRFRAGAAVIGDDGSVVTGCIVENISLGLAMCAERVAMFAAVAAGCRPRALALVAPDTGGHPTWPCGACLQIALELGGRDLVVVVASASEDRAETRVASVGDLLPAGPHRTEPPAPVGDEPGHRVREETT